MSETDDIRAELSRLEARQAAHKAQVDPLVRAAVVNGVLNLAVIFACIAAAAVAITGHLWISMPLSTAGRAIAGAVAIGLLLFDIKLWINAFRYPDAITAIPGYSREELMRRHELRRRLRAADPR